MKLYESINKNRRDYFKTATRKEKLKYLMDYYGLRTIIALIVLVIVISSIISSCNRPTSILGGAFINLYNYDTGDVTQELSQKFLKSEKLDSKKYTTTFLENLNFLPDTDAAATYETQLALNAHMAAGELDFIVASPEFLLTYAYDHSFVNLKTILSKEQFEAYEPYFLYIDMDIVEKLTDISTRMEDTKEIEFPDFKKPEDMKKPVPICIDISHMEEIQNIYHSKKINLGFAFISTGKNLENATKFLDLIAK